MCHYLLFVISVCKSVVGSSEPGPLECAVCYDLFKEPKILGCGHTFCAECIEKLVTTLQGKQIAACPLCCQKSTVPANGYPTNFALLNAISKLEEADFRDANKCRTCSDLTPMNKVVRCKSCTHDIGEDVLICALCAILQHKEHDVAKLASSDEVRDARETNDNNDKYVHDAKPALMDTFKSVEHEFQQVYDKICAEYQAAFTTLDGNISSERSRPDSSTLENALNKSNYLAEHFKANVENKIAGAVTELQQKLRLVLGEHKRNFQRQFKEAGSSKNAGARPTGRRQGFGSRFTSREDLIDFPPLSPSPSAAGQR